MERDQATRAPAEVLTDQTSATIEEVAEGLYESLRHGRLAPMPLRPQDEALLAQCESFHFADSRRLAGWSVGEGRAVLLVHGWGGRGAQMAKIALALADHGFRAVFFDAGAHGNSDPMPMGFDRFMEDAAELQACVGQAPYAWIGHSAGALAMMSARRTHGIAAERFVCIATPFFPYVPIERMQRSRAPQAALDLVKVRIAAQFEASWTQLEGGLAWRPDPAQALMFAYDAADEVARPSDADAILSACPAAALVQTEGLGHNRILQSDKVISAILAHLA
ncbi:alpha/beta hydrolase [Phenylobacterium sp.]|uniref:alpha/beta hydrolase n=1 Tax=Phenylobacterium sp. TaxID=1871053 RepID=UPI0025E7C1E4|nr:alpha/beta hydrolase [Phenylobacterium sp.]